MLATVQNPMASYRCYFLDTYTIMCDKVQGDAHCKYCIAANIYVESESRIADHIKIRDKLKRQKTQTIYAALDSVFF